MDNDIFSRIPRPVILVVLVVLIVLLGWGLYRMAFPASPSPAAAAAGDSSMVIDFPDAEEVPVADSRLDGLALSSGTQSVSGYWERLGKDDGGPDGDVSVVSSEGSRPSPSGEAGDGLHAGSSGLREAVERRQAAEEAGYLEEERRALEAERRMAEERERRVRRLEDGRERARAAAAAAAPAPAPEPAPDPSPVEGQEQGHGQEPRRLETAAPGMSLSGSGIVTSLDDGFLPDGPSGTAVMSPCRATFLRTEKLVSGQRVVMRLMQDMRLSSGQVIPANTHVSGTVTVGDRLRIRVSAIGTADRIYYACIDAYDSDGTEGIYCPVIVDSKARKAGRSVGRQVGEVVSELVGSAVSTASSRLGSVAQRGLSEVTQSVGSDGTVTVSVAAGYEFLLCEDPEESKIDRPQ